eukprot:TRINITY_DN30086_c0_g1_i1.p1 TRINITY_DN30086_c0_g1~~TRINITY_DN30086_c0_g1_i1.p1  ORF type:complete len:320 (+),score=86.79 TRINITY_DN30086_c0_g1_i1:53-1012(+)
MAHVDPRVVLACAELEERDRKAKDGGGEKPEEAQGGSPWMAPGGLAVLAEDVGTNTGRRLPRQALFRIKSVDHAADAAVLAGAGFDAWPEEPDTDRDGDDAGILRQGFRFKRLHRLRPVQVWNRRAAGTPITLAGCASFDTLLLCLKKALQVGDVGALVASYLCVRPVVFSEVAVAAASSDRGDYPLRTVLEAAAGTWWISDAGSMPGGRGNAFLELTLAPDAAPRRVSYVGISIPPLPYGPLSVRTFRVDHLPHAAADWVCGAPLKTIDAPGTQAFELPAPIDAVRVRIVALENANAAEYPHRRSPFDCVGLYHVRLH